MAVLTIFGLIALVLAVLTGSTPLAVIVVALAIAGIVLLVRDWRADGADRADLTQAVAAQPFPVVDVAPPPDSHQFTADEFSPDISTDPDGPSSDARADQR